MIHESLVNSSMLYVYFFHSYLKTYLKYIGAYILYIRVYGPTKTKGGPGVGRQINHATRTDKLFGGRPAAILAYSLARV